MQIYLITNRANGKVYVGQTSKDARERWRQHIQSCRRGSEGRLYTAMRKWGVGGFEVCTIRMCSSPEELDRFEQLFITLFNAGDRNFGYNIDLGGRFRIVSEETKKKLREVFKGRPAHNRGKAMSEQQKRKLREIRLGTPAHNKGVVYGEDVRKKQRAAWTPERKAAHAKRNRDNGLVEKMRSARLRS
jgi:group I intron endonuclease